MEELLITNGPHCQPTGMGAGWGCAPSCAEHGKLKYNMVSMIFSTSHLNDTLGFRTNTCSGSMECN